VGIFQVQALISLATTADGGLSVFLPSSTRSFLLQFDPGTVVNPETTVGAVVWRSDGREFCPGDQDVKTIIEPWADEAQSLFRVNVPFFLWYGRTVGHGVVVRVQT